MFQKTVIKLAFSSFLVLAIFGLHSSVSAAQLTGDINSDGTVSLSDLAILAGNWGAVSGATLATGDLNGDHAVNLPDLAILAAHYGNISSELPPVPDAAAIIATSGNSVSLSWDSVSSDSPITYLIYRNGNIVNDTSSTTSTDSSLSGGATYTYAVAASDFYGISDQTASVTATTQFASGPLLGAIEPSLDDATLASDGFAAIIIPAIWSNIEPTEGNFSLTAINAVQAQINTALAAGLSVSLDIGVQYAPSWVFSIGGGTYFTDQFSDQFTGSAYSGNYVPNAVTDNNVRSAMAVYLSYLGANLTGYSSVRLGGGPDNELRYPGGTYSTHTNAYWFYDSSSQAELPADARGWIPGTGTVQQATEFINTYNAALVNYGQWLITQGSTDFTSGTKLILLLPGWGERPGEMATAENNLLSGTPDEVNQGLDWTDLLSAIGSNSNVVAYSTWADATFGGSGNPDPAAYINSILPSGMLAGGESTGNGNTTDAGMDLMFTDAENWNWYMANWFFGGQNQSASDVFSNFANP